MRILIADDDPVSRTVLAKILTAQPEHTVTVADDGGAAWELLDDPGRSFDVAFLDLSMPKMDGFALLRRIRDAALLKSLEVVLCTASNDRATVVKAVQLGAKHYLVKPCTEAVVLAKLRQLQPV
jgi:two-component system chemotaxis response regulator CheY